MEPVINDVNTIDASPDVITEKTWSETVHPEALSTTTDSTGMPTATTGTVTASDTSTQAVNDLQSSNFKFGSTGWRLGANGVIDAIGAKLASSAQIGDGSDGIVIDEDGIRGYNSTLGNVFNLPTDGTPPTFANGTISESTFEINTNAVLRTSDTVGDGTANSAGVLINNTGVYGLQANQTPATGSIRIKTEGTLFAGDEDNYINWDGTYLRLKGSFDVGTGGVVNNSVYTVANLPAQPTTVGFNNPSSNSAY